MDYRDNLTDLVERLQDDKGQKDENSTVKEGEVKNEEGEVIKLNDK